MFWGVFYVEKEFRQIYQKLFGTQHRLYSSSLADDWVGELLERRMNNVQIFTRTSEMNLY